MGGGYDRWGSLVWSFDEQNWLLGAQASLSNCLRVVRQLHVVLQLCVTLDQSLLCDRYSLLYLNDLLQVRDGLLSSHFNLEFLVCQRFDSQSEQLVALVFSAVTFIIVITLNHLFNWVLISHLYCELEVFLLASVLSFELSKKTCLFTHDWRSVAFDLMLRSSIATSTASTASR